MNVTEISIHSTHNRVDKHKTHITDLFAASMGFILRSLQNGGKLVFGTFILLSVLPLKEEDDG